MEMIMAQSSQMNQLVMQQMLMNMRHRDAPVILKETQQTPQILTVT